MNCQGSSSGLLPASSMPPKSCCEQSLGRSERNSTTTSCCPRKPKWIQMVVLFLPQGNPEFETALRCRCAKLLLYVVGLYLKKLIPFKQTGWLNEIPWHSHNVRKVFRKKLYTACPGVYDPNNHCSLTAHMIHQARLSRLILKFNFSQRRPIRRPSDQDFQENQPLLCLLRIFSLPLVEKLPFCPGKSVSNPPAPQVQQGVSFRRH